MRAEAHYSLGVTYYQQGRLDEAIREYQAALRIKFTVIIEAVDQLEADEPRLLAQRLEERLAGMQH